MPRGKLQAAAEALLFEAFVQCHGNLSATSRLLSDADVPISKRTLDRYSKRFEWRLRYRSAEEAARREQDQRALETLRELRERTTRAGKATTAAGLTLLQRLLADAKRSDAVTAASIARLLDAGHRLETFGLASEEAYRQRIARILSRFISAAGEQFLRANALDDPEERKRLFGPPLDEALNKIIADEGVDDIVIEGAPDAD